MSKGCANLGDARLPPLGCIALGRRRCVDLVVKALRVVVRLLDADRSTFHDPPRANRWSSAVRIFEPFASQRVDNNQRQTVPPSPIGNVGGAMCVLFSICACHPCAITMLIVRMVFLEYPAQRWRRH